MSHLEKSLDDMVERYIKLYNNIRDFYKKLKSAKQKGMAVPTDPEEIHRRAAEIRVRLKEEKKLAKDLRIIKYDLRFNPPKEKRPLLKKLIKKIRERRK